MSTICPSRPRDRAFAATARADAIASSLRKVVGREAVLAAADAVNRAAFRGASKFELDTLLLAQQDAIDAALERKG